MQIIFYFWPFEINGNILRIQKVSSMFRTIYTRQLFVFDPNLEMSRIIYTCNRQYMYFVLTQL